MLHVAAAAGHYAIVNLILRATKSAPIIKTLDIRGQGPAHAAAGGGHVGILEVLPP